MSRLILLGAVIAVVYWLLKSYRGRVPEKKEWEGRAENMVRCAYCGVHLPQSESIQSNGKYYCSEAHYKAAVPGSPRG